MEVVELFFRVVLTIIVQTVKLLFRLLRGLLWLGVTLFRPRSKTFGSARWARLVELIWGGVWHGEGLIVGKKWWRFIRFNQDGYAILFAPTRSGKGVGVVVPNLLDYKGSIICTDPKGENSAITGRARTRRGRVLTLNAIHPELSDCLNPLDMVRTGSYHEADDAMELAKLLIIPDSSNGGHWDNRAGEFLQALILYVCLKYAGTPELRNLAKVRSFVSLGAEAIQPIIEDAMALGSTTLRESMKSFQNMATSDEAKSIFSNCEKAVNLWGSDRPAGMISMRSDFDFRQFNRETMTCYIIVDEEKLQIYAGFLRVFMGAALMAMTRAKSEAAPRYPTLFLLDETAALGRLEPLETGVGYLATYARLLLVFQDLDQLRRTYPKSQSMLANAGCKIAFGVNDPETARMLADSIGHTTVRGRSTGQSGSADDLVYQHSNKGRSESGRYLRDPAEIMRESRKKSLIFFNGTVRYPVLAGKVRYYKERRWKGHWDRWRQIEEEPTPATVIPFPALPPADNGERVA